MLRAQEIVFTQSTIRSQEAKVTYALGCERQRCLCCLLQILIRPLTVCTAATGERPIVQRCTPCKEPRLQPGCFPRAASVSGGPLQVHTAVPGALQQL